MNNSIYHIAMIDLLWVFIPVVIMMVIYFRWTKDTLTLPYALIRMLTQLILIGYVLTYIFNESSHQKPKNFPYITTFQEKKVKSFALHC